MEVNVYQQFENLERDHWWFRGRRAVYLGLLDTLLQESSVRRVLDLGCGMGGFQAGLRARVDEVFGCDMDYDSLEVCHARDYKETCISECGTLPFADNSFDLVCLFDVLEHMEDDALVLREVHRVLAPGGIIFLSVPAYQFLYANNDRVAQHFRRYDRSMIAERLPAAGFEVEKNSYSNVLLSPLIIPLVLLIKAWESLLNRDQHMQHSNLSWSVPRWINEILYRLFAAELPGTRRWNWAFGHSMIVAGRKPGLGD